MLLVLSRKVLSDHCYVVALQDVSRPETIVGGLSILFSEDGWVSLAVDASLLCSTFETAIHGQTVFPRDGYIFEGVDAVLPRSTFEAEIQQEMMYLISRRWLHSGER